MHAVKRGLDKVLGVFAVSLFAVLVVVVVWQVFSRQVMNDPATWTEEAARMVFVWVGLISAAFVFGERGHIAVEFIVRKFPTRVEVIIAVAVQLIVLFFAVVVLIWGGWRASQGAWTQNLSALPFTFGQMYLALPVAGVLSAFYSVYFLVGIITGKEEPYPVVEDPMAEQIARELGGTTAAPAPGTPAAPDDPRGPGAPGTEGGRS